MKRKFLFFVLTLAFVCLFAVSVSAVEVDGIYYSFTNTDAYPGYDGTATVTNENRTSGTITEIIIPEIVEYDSDGDGTPDKRYIVTEIASGAIGNNGGSNSPVVSIVVPKTVAKIGEHAFRQLKYVESIVIKAQGYNPVTGETSNLSFTNAEFYNSTTLKTVDMSESNIIKVGSVCFSGCSALTEVKLSSKIEAIGGNAFNNCAELVTVSDLEAVKSIGANAFQGCRKLAGNIKLSSLETISNNAFQFTNITSVDMTGATVELIDKHAFYDCPSLESVILPSSVKEIGQTAFYSCESLTTINLPSGITSLGTGAFYGSKIEGDFVLNSLTSIGENAFRETNVTSVDFTGSTFTIINNHTFRSCLSLTSVTLPSSLTEICEGVFYGCSNLTRANIPSSVKILGTSAFQNASITGDVVLDYLESIGAHALRGTSITSFIVKDGSAADLGNDATFFGCTSLKYVMLPKALTALNNFTFGDCSSLEFIVAYENLATIADSAISNTSSLKSIILPSNSTDNICAALSTWDVAPFGEYDPASADAKTIYYGATPTKSATTFLDFSSFGKSFYTWDALTNTKTEYVAPFKALGYTAKEDSTGFGTGFEINSNSLAAYKELTGKDVSFGILIFNPKYLGNDSFISNGEINASSGALIAEISTEYSSCSLLINGFNLENASHSSLELVFAGFAYTADDKSDLELIQKEYNGTSESPVSSPMASRITRNDATLYSVKLQAILTPSQITTGKEGLLEYVA